MEPEGYDHDVEASVDQADQADDSLAAQPDSHPVEAAQPGAVDVTAEAPQAGADVPAAHTGAQYDPQPKHSFLDEPEAVTEQR